MCNSSGFNNEQKADGTRFDIFGGRIKVMSNMMVRVLFLGAALWLGLLVSAGSVFAAQGEPIVLTPDGEPVVAPVVVPEDGVELPAVQDDDDPVSTPRALEYDYDIYVSSPGNGTYGNISYADEDILRYSTKNGSWTKVFDGTNEGLPAAADIDALAYQPINLGQIYYMSFEQPTAVPGLGTVDDSDVVAHTYVFGQSAIWSMVFDGSQYGLTTDAEDVDAIDFGGAEPLRLSTLGGFSVPKYGGGTLKGADEDVITFIQAQGTYTMFLDATTIGVLKDNDLRSFALARINDDDVRFISFQRTAKLQWANSGYPAVTLAPNDIAVDERPFVGPRLFGVLWDASAHGFPKVDAIDVVKK